MDQRPAATSHSCPHLGLKARQRSVANVAFSKAKGNYLHIDNACRYERNSFMYVLHVRAYCCVFNYSKQYMVRIRSSRTNSDVGNAYQSCDQVSIKRVLKSQSFGAFGHNLGTARGIAATSPRPTQVGRRLYPQPRARSAACAAPPGRLLAGKGRAHGERIRLVDSDARLAGTGRRVGRGRRRSWGRTRGRAASQREGRGSRAEGRSVDGRGRVKARQGQ